MNRIPIYKYPAAYASENNELDQYRASHKANIACKEAIETAIRDHYRNNRLGIEAVNLVLETYGMERVMYVLANTVKLKEWDARISPENKAWAATIPINQNPDSRGTDRNLSFVLNCHPGLTDLFLTQARKVQAERQADPSDHSLIKERTVLTENGVEELYLGFQSQSNFKDHPDRICYVPENWDFEDGPGYTGNDFLALCNGDIQKATALFNECEWQHPETVLDEWERELEAEQDVVQTVSVKTKLGELVASIKCDSDYPGISIYLKGPGINANFQKDCVGLAWVEFDPTKNKIQTVVYGDGSSEEYTHLIEHENIIARDVSKPSLDAQIQRASDASGTNHSDVSKSSPER